MIFIQFAVKKMRTSLYNKKKGKLFMSGGMIGRLLGKIREISNHVQ